MSKIAAPLTSILKTIVLLQVLFANKVLATNKVGDVEGGNELIEKYRKLSKTGKLPKSQKLSKSRKSAKSKKKLSKSGNLPNFDAKENRPSFLTLNTRTAFNYLQLASPKLRFFNILI